MYGTIIHDFGLSNKLLYQVFKEKKIPIHLNDIDKYQSNKRQFIYEICKQHYTHPNNYYNYLDITNTFEKRFLDSNFSNNI